MSYLNFEIDPKYLSDDQISYELRIRNLQPNESRESRSKILKRAFQKNIPVTTNTTFDFESEKEVVEKTLQDITTAIAELDTSQIRVVREIETQLAYVTKRMLTFSACPHATCLELEADFVDKVEGTPLNQTPLCNSTLKTSAVLRHAAAKSVPVYKWGVSYDGRSDLVAFLEKVNDLTVARSVTEDELFRSAYDLFTEPALTWYRSVRDTVGSWNQLVTLLKTNFLPSDYDVTIWEHYDHAPKGPMNRPPFTSPR
ncbi:hypothetical protein GEV33_000489 [Tenebrio molitor]|uniref:Retrotransposon gag domain-containing protein n=1 Tax=Tenebrio molitor TaxID=7067 RepID=A0A8J6HXE7_TENMO|nr:hypothetical protein GEV33_000489 [Tenebrio molitor]